MPARREHLRRQLDRLCEITGDLLQRSHKQIPKRVALQLTARAEAMPKKLRQKLLVFRKSNHAVAQIARRQHVEVLAQPPGRTPIIGDRHHRRELADQILGHLRTGWRKHTRSGKVFETAQQRRKTRAPAHGDHTQCFLRNRDRGDGDRG